MTFDYHERAISPLTFHKAGLLSKCRFIFNDDIIGLNSLFSFILPFFYYCCPVWMSQTHLELLKRPFNLIKFLLTNLNMWLESRRIVRALTLLFKIVNNNEHPLHSALPAKRVTHALQPNFSSINQFSRTFIHSMSKVWNLLLKVVVFEVAINQF